MKTSGLAGTLKTGLNRSRLQVGATSRERKPLPFAMEDLEQGRNEWKNIPDIVRVGILGMLQWAQDQEREIGDLRERTDITEWRREVKEEIEAKANLDDVKQTLDHVAESMDEKVSRSDVGHLLTTYVKSDDLFGELESRPTKAEVNRWLDHKAEESELREEVQKLNEKIDRLSSELSAIQSTAAGVSEVAAIRDRLEKKLDTEIFKESIKKLVTFEELHEVASKKADFEEIEEVLQRKVDGDDLNQVISILEKKADSELVEEMIDVLKNKAEAKDLELVTVAINKKSDRLQCEENTSHIIMIRKEVESLFEELDHTFADVKKLLEKNSQDLEACGKEVGKRCTKTELAEVRQILSRKVESSLFLEELSKVRDDQGKEVKNARSEAEKFRRLMEDGKLSQEKKLDSERKAIAESIRLLKTEMDTLLSDKSREMDEMVKFIKGLHENMRTEMTIEQESATASIKDVRKRLEFIDKDKASSEEVRGALSELNKIIKMKVDIDEVQASLNACQADNAGKLIDLREELLTALKNQNVAMAEQLSKKPNAVDVKKQLASKIDNDSIEQMLENYLGTLELEGVIEQVKDLQSQVLRIADRDADVHVKVLKEDVEDFRRTLATKANLQEISSLLDQKCSIDDVNKSLKMVKTALQDKCTMKELELYTKEQAMINEFLCAENVVGRWRWRSGMLQNKTLVPWEEQTINTLTDNFLWEKNDTFITVIVSGLYEITFGLFAKKKPAGQFFVNGEPVLSLMNATSYAVHHSSGKLKDLKSNPAQSNSSSINNSVPTGLTYVEYLILPPRARISLSFICDCPGEGFLSIKRLT